jgi:class 3 adenylate cyclase
MSLRVKALIAALVLVTAVTGGLVWLVQSEYEKKERARIDRELAEEVPTMEDRMDDEVRLKLALLRSTLLSEQLGHWLAHKGDVKENFGPIAETWAESTGVDYAIAALDATKAEDGAAVALHRGESLWILTVRPPRLTPDDRSSRFAYSDRLRALMTRSFDSTVTASEVVAVESALYLAVATPLFAQTSSYQRFVELEDRVRALRRSGDAAGAVGLQQSFEEVAVGVACLLTNLNDEWARESLRRSSHTVLFSDGAVAAHTFPTATPAAEALAEGGRGSAQRWEVPLTTADGTQRYIAFAGNFDKSGPFGFQRPGFVALASLDEALEPLQALRRKILVIGGLLAFAGSLLAYALSYVVIRKLRALEAAAKRVQDGDFAVTVDIRSRDEVGKLGAAFNNMIRGLRALGLYTDQKLARQVLENSGITPAGDGSRHEGTILFTDIRNFTGITETMDPSALTGQLNEYFTAIGDLVAKEDGYIDKFIGDAVMAYWGPPLLAAKDHALRACRAALHANRDVAELRRRWEREGRPLFHQRIGIATGDVVTGNIGSAKKKNYTVIGDPVNLANRLEGANKIYGTEILVDERTIELASGAVLAREIDHITVRGRTKPVRVFELLGLAAETRTRPLRLIETYGRALAAYRAGDYAAALAALEGPTQTDPDDGPSKWLAERCREAQRSNKAPPTIMVTRTFDPQV